MSFAPPKGKRRESKPKQDPPGQRFATAYRLLRESLDLFEGLHADGQCHAGTASLDDVTHHLHLAATYAQDFGGEFLSRTERRYLGLSAQRFQSSEDRQGYQYLPAAYRTDETEHDDVSTAMVTTSPSPPRSGAPRSASPTEEHADDAVVSESEESAAREDASTATATESDEENHQLPTDSDEASCDAVDVSAENAPAEVPVETEAAPEDKHEREEGSPGHAEETVAATSQPEQSHRRPSTEEMNNHTVSRAVAVDEPRSTFREQVAEQVAVPESPAPRQPVSQSTTVAPPVPSRETTPRKRRSILKNIAISDSDSDSD